MSKTIIQTDDAPAAIGAYSQAVKIGSTVYTSGQIPLVPATMEVVAGDFSAQVQQVFKNLAAVAKAAGGDLDDCVKMTIFLTDLANFGQVNEIMAQYVSEPFPARSTVQISALPKNVDIEIEAILSL